jgi:hypothetical protein
LPGFAAGSEREQSRAESSRTESHNSSRRLRVSRLRCGARGGRQAFVLTATGSF